MKKMFMIAVVFTMMAGLFAYEPKKECVTVKGNKVIYYVQTEVWNIYGWEPEISNKKLNQDYVKWVIRKGYTIEQLVGYEFKRLEKLRPHINEYGRLIQATGELGEYNKRTAIISIPFVTEENYLTLSKEDMLAKMYAFIAECTK